MSESSYGLGEYGQGEYGRYDAPVAPGIQTPRPPADVRVRVYAPNGDTLGLLPTPTDLSAQIALNDVGALSLEYPLGAPRASLLGSPVELALEATWDGGQTWHEPPSGRFQYLRDEGDGTKPWEGYKITALGYVKRLEKALVGSAGLDGEGRRSYVGVSPGAILADLWDLAQARGVLVGMNRTWTAEADSNGTPWPAFQSIAYEPGVNLLAVIQGMADQGWLDFRTTGRSVQVYVTDSPTGMGEDQTLGELPVTLRYGRDLTEAPFRRTWEALADTVLVQGEDRVFVTRTNPGAITPWGRQETYATASGVTDNGTLSAIGDAALTFTEKERVEHTLGLEFATTPHLPFRDYLPGHWVYASTDSNMEPARMRLRGITVTRDSQGNMGGNVTLNDKFLEGDILQNRRIQGIIGGATQAGTGGIPSGIGNDILQPAQVTGLVASSAAFVDPDGQIKAQISTQWADTVTNADGTPASDIDHYEVWARVPLQNAEWAQVATTTASEWFNSPYSPGVAWEFKVRAVDTVYNMGAFSAPVQVLTQFDTTPPPKPSAPTATTRLGTARISWDGLTATGSNMADTVADFRYVDAHVSQVNNFAPSAATRVGELGGSGYVVAGPLDYSATYYARLVAYDSSGNPSVVSDQTAVTVAPLVDVSNFPDDAMQTLYARTAHFIDVTADMMTANSVTTMALAAGAITAEKIAAAAVTADKVSTGLLQANVKIVAGALLNSGARVELRADGLFAYDAAGVQTFGLTAASGSAAFSGAITSGTTIDGATITGGVVRSASSGARAELRGDGATGYPGIFIYDASGYIGGFGQNGAGSVSLGGPGSVSLSAGGSLEIDAGVNYTRIWKPELGQGGNSVISPGIRATGTSGQLDVRIHSTNNIMFYDTSALKFKTNVRPLRMNDKATVALGEVAKPRKNVLDIEPIVYQDKYEVKKHQEKAEGWEAEPGWHLGFSAESFLEGGYPELVTMDTDGTPLSLDYGRVSAAIVASAKERFAEMEARVAALEAALAGKVTR